MAIDSIIEAAEGRLQEPRQPEVDTRAASPDSSVVGEPKDGPAGAAPDVLGDDAEPELEDRGAEVGRPSQPSCAVISAIPKGERLEALVEVDLVAGQKRGKVLRSHLDLGPTERHPRHLEAEAQACRDEALNPNHGEVVARRIEASIAGSGA
jgi:hypothetical protein